MVRSATGEDLLTGHLSWFAKILIAEKEALMPNRFEIDPNGDWGGFQGAVIPRELPARLAYVLAGTASGPAARRGERAKERAGERPCSKHRGPEPCDRGRVAQIDAAIVARPVDEGSASQIQGRRATTERRLRGESG